MKKTLLLIALVLCCATTIFAQNNKISYQAVVRDTENKLVANKDVTVTVKIFDGDVQQPAYTQTYENVHTNLNGLISLLIGPAQPNEAWNSIQWNQARIETTVTLDNTQLGTLSMPLTAVPYALYAKEISPDAVVITNIYNKMQQDSTALADKMRADSLLLHKALIDSTAHIRTEIDTTSKAIRNTLTTTANAIRSEVDTKLQSYAQLGGDNTFTGNNTFGTVNASSVTVTCGENVTANVCDLLERIKTLEQKINNPQTLLDLIGQMNDEQKRTLKNALGIYVTLNKSTTTITTGGSEVLVAKVWQSEAAQEIQWSSSNPSVATVNNDGVVYAVTTGETVITAKSVSEPSHYATCIVTVSSPQPNALFNLKRNDDGSWEVTMPTNDLEVEIEVYNE